MLFGSFNVRGMGNIIKKQKVNELNVSKSLDFFSYSGN